MEMDTTELMAAHGELVREVSQHKLALHDDRYIPGQVPRWVIPRLTGCAAMLGYPVRYRRYLLDGACGLTQTDECHGVLTPESITLLDGMTPASTARTLAHELAHALKHAAAARGQGRIAHGDAEEVTAETSGHLICRTMRVPGDEASVAWLSIASRRSLRLLEWTRYDSVQRASVLLEAMA